MLTGININERVEFISKYDKNEPKTVFTMRPLTGLEMLNFSAGAKEDIVKMVESSVVSVKNFSGFTEVRDILNSLSMNVLGELIEQTNKLNGITEEDAKN